jgi:hypothetical protein
MREMASTRPAGRALLDSRVTQSEDLRDVMCLYIRSKRNQINIKITGKSIKKS